MNETLESSLRATGVPCRVETRDRLAILVPDGAIDAIPMNAGERSRIIQIARSEGFTHVAIELDPDVASLPGD